MMPRDGILYSAIRAYTWLSRTVRLLVTATKWTSCYRPDAPNIFNVAI
jgi:hypothetical protein